jgi:hypothetical protein
VLALGVVLMPIGAIWVAYAISQASTTKTTTGTVSSDSLWPIVAFFVAFIGGILVTVGNSAGCSAGSRGAGTKATR